MRQDTYIRVMLSHKDEETHNHKAKKFPCAFRHPCGGPPNTAKEVGYMTYTKN